MEDACVAENSWQGNDKNCAPELTVQFEQA
jgi:hypothetical protein